MRLFFFFFSSMLFNSKPEHAVHSNPGYDYFSPGDSILINHRQDGLTSEWPAEKFETDLATDIKFAIDNDGDNLYMALKIANEGIQMKVMNMGMNMYIDLKGKKKENRGIIFPVREEKAKNAAPANNDQKPEDPAPKKSIDKKQMRSTMALHLIYMQVFGFDGSGKRDQGLNIPGSINVAFTWDSLNIMHMEYLVPLKMLGDSISLKDKEISIGWKLNGMYPSDNPAYYSQQASSSQHRIGADNNPIIERETIIREQNIWKKHIIKFTR